MRRIDRREFGQEAGLAFLSGLAISFTACGGGSGSPSAGTPTTTLPAGGPSAEVGDVSANHGHSAVIEAAKVAAGGAIQIDISGSAGHPHRVSLPADAMRDIKDGKPVQLMSSTDDGHQHLVTFNSDNPAPPTRY